jgi:hypothetical protein
VLLDLAFFSQHRVVLLKHKEVGFTDQLVCRRFEYFLGYGWGFRHSFGQTAGEFRIVRLNWGDRRKFGWRGIVENFEFGWDVGF